MSISTLTIGFVTGVVATLLVRFFQNRWQLGNGKISERSERSQNQRELQRNIQNAIRDLSQFCKEHPDELPTYLVLGNLFRIAGEAQRSIVIHQNILTEKNLPKQLEEQAKFELACDFLALGVEEQAVKRLGEVSERSPLFFVAHEKLIDIYFSHGKYEKAFDAVEKILKRKKTWRNRKRAAYFLSLEAQSLVDSGELPSAKKDD